MRKKSFAALSLMRPANIVTSFADILAGFGIAAVPLLISDPNPLLYFLGLLFLLLIATAGLYGGGVVFNDVCDAELDKVERPERPIPKGIISKTSAILLALGLWLIGIITAFLVSSITGWLAVTVIILSILYDAKLKHYLILGPLAMGLCRSGNLLIGMSIVTAVLLSYWPIMFIPLVFISGVTLISKGEVHGGDKFLVLFAILLFIIALLMTLSLTFSNGFHFYFMLPYLVLFILLMANSLYKTLKTLAPPDIKNSVRTGIMCLIILDAAIASGYAGWWFGIIILLLLPISLVLAKKFAMT